MDWDDAYANGVHIPGAADYPPRWATAAATMKADLGSRHRILTYGQGPRNVMDLMVPEATPIGLFVFIHGGYWMKFAGADWLHLASGALNRGWAVAMPTYTLSPDARISAMTVEMSAAIATAAAEINGPIRLAGHSAGGHLVSRMACTDAPIPTDVAGRISHIVSISGLHDLRPLMRTAMNDTLALDEAEAQSESAALQAPRDRIRITCWVGANERPEFVRQNALLANIWTGLGAETRAVEETDRHHFDVIDGLADPSSPLMTEVLSDA